MQHSALTFMSWVNIKKLTAVSLHFLMCSVWVIVPISLDDYENMHLKL